MLALRIIVSLLILPYFICPPQVFAQSMATKNQSQMLYQKVLSMVEKKSALIQRALPPGNVMVVQTEKDAAVKEELQRRLDSFENMGNAELAQFKLELLKINEQELGEINRELQGFLNAMSEKELSDIATFLKGHKLYTNADLELMSSFTINEKRAAIRKALVGDLSFLRSIYNKKLGKSSKEQLKADLKKNLQIYTAQTSQKMETKQLLQISLLVLAGIALATWGISSAVYGARLSRIRSDREAKLTDLQNTLNAQYQAYKDQLTQEELDYLNKNGYFRTICGNFQQQDSILCNRYNYQLFSGLKHCTIYCYKNLETGKETLHEPAVCSSSFIPTDCYDPQEYWDAYARGEDDGEDDGYYDGEDDGEDDGWYDGWHRGDSNGWDDGYADGYDNGYDDGYSSGSSSLKAKAIVPYERSQEYLRGFKDGLEQYQILFLSI